MDDKDEESWQFIHADASWDGKLVVRSGNSFREVHLWSHV